MTSGAGLFFAAEPRALEFFVFVLAERLREAVGVERRVGAHREHFAVERVQRHERPGVGRFAAGASVVDALEQRLFGLALQRQRDRGLEVVAGLRRCRLELARLGIAFGVDLDSLHPGPAAQVAVVVVLEPGLPDDGALLDAGEGAQLELVFRDLADVAELVGGHRPERVGADRDRLLSDAREVVLALGKDRQHTRPGVGLDRDGRIRQRRAPADHERLDVLGAHPQQRAQPFVQLQPGPARGRQRRGHDLDGVGDLVARDRPAFAGEDFPARSGDRQVAHALGFGLRDVVFAGQHLQVPEAKEDHAEHHDRDPAEDRHAEGHLRGHGRHTRRARRAAASRVARAKAFDRAHVRDKGLKPPVV